MTQYEQNVLIRKVACAMLNAERGIRAYDSLDMIGDTSNDVKIGCNTLASWMGVSADKIAQIIEQTMLALKAVYENDA